MGNVTKRNSRFVFFISFVCFLTNIGQSPFLIDNFQTRLIVIPIWMVFAFVCFCRNHVINVSVAKDLLLFVIFFAIYYFVGSIFISAYGNSDLPYCIFLSSFIFFVGLLAGFNIDWWEIEQISTSYIISSAVVTLDTYVTYIYGQSLAGRVYLYNSKNSVSQIIFTGWVLILFLKFNNSTSFLKKVIYVLIFGLMTITLLGLKSRATLIAIPVVFIWIIVHGRMNRKLRNYIVFALAILVIALLINPSLLDNTINNIVLGGRDATDLNDVTSGRADEWSTFFSDFADKPFFGHGRMKRESLVLTSFLEFGLFGGGLIIMIAVYPLFWVLRRLKKHHPMYLMYSTICIVYVLNGIFEQLAPFGPGVKCYFLWFLLGVIMSSSLSDGAIELVRDKNG